MSNDYDYEKLGVFYLGKQYNLATQKVEDAKILYDAKDLTTHAVCVGMTGSGKTGLCLALLEEAAIDGIPAICIDPKGDLGNLALSFPDLRPTDFKPWVDPAEATRRGMTVDEFAKNTAEKWKAGLAEWGQPPERIQRFRDAAEVTIYTPGSSSGIPITVVRSFASPSQAILNDSDAMRDRVNAAVSSVLSLLGYEDDPLRSKEHILLANILDHAWRNGRDLEIADLVRLVQQPPFEKVGVLDLESFYKTKDRAELAMNLNNLMASPGFAAWMQGESLDIQRLLYTPQGKPRLAIMSIAHLSDSERMFFVTLLLSEVISWMRAQSGTSSLRALLYMDEVFGYFPPTANPPSKTPMLTLMKQARAFGLGVVLATQNPVDLDYKGLSNAGTWLLGRLQTERDKARVMEGLEGANAAAGARFDRDKMEKTLAGLGNRVFLLNNVHEDQPEVFQSRWALSYLRGPLTREQIATVMGPRKQSMPALGPSATPRREPIVAGEHVFGDRPVAPAGVDERFVAFDDDLSEGDQLVYRASIMGEAKTHFVDSKSSMDMWENLIAEAEVVSEMADDPWAEATVSDEPSSLEYADEPANGARFGELPTELTRAKTFASLATKLKDQLYRTRKLQIYKSSEFKVFSKPNESEADFRVRLAHEIKEDRDLEMERLRAKYSPKVAAITEQIRKAEQRVSKEQEEAKGQMFSSMISFGATILGALTGRKMMSSTNLGKVATSVRGTQKIAKARKDVTIAEENLEVLEQKLADLNAECEEEVAKIAAEAAPDKLVVEPITLTPKKSEIQVERVVLLWRPWIYTKKGEWKQP